MTQNHWQCTVENVAALDDPWTIFSNVQEVHRLHRSVFKVARPTDLRVDHAACTATLRSGDTFEVNARTDWDSIESSLGVTARLWLYTSQFLTLIPEDHEDLDEILASYFEWLSHRATDELESNFASWDHATAWRLESSWVLLPRATGHARAVIAESILRDLSWSTKPENIKLNNHGAFLISSLLFAIPHLSPNFSTYEDPVTRVVKDRLPQILTAVYGANDDGWCAENSPLYDRVWINLLRSMVSAFREDLSKLGLLSRLESILKRADDASRFMIYPDGDYVPRGDTFRQSTGLKPNFGTSWNCRVGVWVHSEPQVYIMATSGHASSTHKHVDDTQVLLRWNGVDFFLDGGFHSYNYTDARNRVQRTSYSHSVLDIDSAPILPPWDAYRDGFERISGSMTQASSVSVTMRKRVDGSHLQRVFEFDPKNRELTFIDTLRSPVPAVPIARFIIGTDAVVLSRHSGLTIQRANQSVTFIFHSQVSWEHIKAEEDSPHRGWYSDGPSSLHAGSVVELRPVKGTELRYAVRLDDAAPA